MPGITMNFDYGNCEFELSKFYFKMICTISQTHQCNFEINKYWKRILKIASYWGDFVCFFFWHFIIFKTICGLKFESLKIENTDFNFNYSCKCMFVLIF